MRRKQNGTMFLFWMLTYVVIGAIGVAAVIVSYNVSKKMMYDNTLYTNQKSVENIKEHFDQVFSSLEKTVTDSAENELLRQSAKDKAPLDVNKRYKLAVLADKLSVYQNRLKSIDKTFFYLKNDGVVIFNGSSIDMKDFYIMSDTSYTLGKWEQLLAEDTGNFLRSVTMRNGDKYFLYVSSNYFKRIYNTDNLSFCALIKRENIDFLNNDVNLSIVSENTNTVLNINHNIGIEKKAVWKLSDNSKKANINGEKFVCNVVRSDVWNLRYAALVSEKLLFSKLVFMRNIYFVILVTLIFITTLLACKFARRNSTGWDNIISVFDNGDEHLHGKDVLNKVYKEVAGLMDNYRLLQNDTKHHIQKLKENYIMDLCVNTVENDELFGERLKELGTDFSYRYFSLMLIYPQTQDNFSIYAYTFKSIAQSILEKECKILIGERRCFLICIINYDSASGLIPPQILENLRASVEIIQETLGDRLGEKIYYSVSNTVDRAENIHKAYNEALADMDKMLMKEEKNDALQEKEFTDNAYGYQNEILLINAIQTGNEATAVRLVHEMFANLKNDKEIMEIGIRYFVYDLFCAIFRAAVKIGEPAVEYMKNFQYRMRIDSARLEREYRSLITECVKGLCELRNSTETARESKGVRLEEKITQYIYDNYQDCDMGLKKIADKFDMNLSYISASYREKCGVGIAERLEKFRMIKAIEFLDKGEKVTDVARMVGYQNVRTFSKAFKRNYNVSPSEYNGDK